MRPLNSMVPIWKKSKKELKDEDYNSFYTQKFYGLSAAAGHIHSSVEGAVTYTAMLFIPSHAPMDYYTERLARRVCSCTPTAYSSWTNARSAARSFQLCTRHGRYGRSVAQHLP